MCYIIIIKIFHFNINIYNVISLNFGRGKKVEIKYIKCKI